MRYLTTVAAVFAVTAAIAACGGGQDAAEAPEETTETAAPAAEEAPAPAVDGGAVFATNCATCHGEGGAGDGLAAMGLEPPPADLTDAEWTLGDGSVETIVTSVESGSPGTASQRCAPLAATPRKGVATSNASVAK